MELQLLELKSQLHFLHLIAAFIVYWRKCMGSQFPQAILDQFLWKKLMVDVYVNTQFTKTLSLFTLVASLCVHIAQIRWKYAKLRITNAQ